MSLILYLVSAGASYGLFSALGARSGPITTETPSEAEGGQTALGALLEIDPAAPKDQPCPLNGKMYTQIEKDAWSKRRPLFVMIENSVEARPQSGLTRADVIFEAVAEGGITRFGAMFYCAAQAQDVTVAPVRSARTYFVDWASGFNKPMYVHVGGANVPGPADALGQISDYGWNLNNDINQFSVGYPTFYRDYNRVPGKELATEHTMVSTTEGLWAVATDREWTNLEPERTIGKKTIGGTDWREGYEGWSFETEKATGGDPATNVSYGFWSGYGSYDVAWEYDSALDAYKRVMGGESHIDSNNNEQVAAANVIVLKTMEKGPIDEKKHMLYTTTGTGQAVIFKHGQAFDVTWSKKDREAELKFLDTKGKDFELAPGLTWISVVDKGNKITY